MCTSRLSDAPTQDLQLLSLGMAGGLREGSSKHVNDSRLDGSVLRVRRGTLVSS